jgi:hypothetical protein
MITGGGGAAVVVAERCSSVIATAHAGIEHPSDSASRGETGGAGVVVLPLRESEKARVCEVRGHAS